jgi:hypothetical protein
MVKLEFLESRSRESLLDKSLRVVMYAPAVTLGGLLVVVILAPASALWAVSVATLTVLTWVLTRSKVTHLLKWTAVFFFILGLYFDLLYT